MPVYEYRCNDCKRLITLYVRGFSEIAKADCTACGSENVTRLFSRFAIHKTYQDVYEDILSDKELVSGMIANDPRALAKWSRKMEGASGDDIGPEYEEMMERLDHGENWETVAADMRESGVDETGGSEASELG